MQMPYGDAERTPQRTFPRSGVVSASPDRHAFYDVDAYNDHNTVLAAFLEARGHEVDGQAEAGNTIRAILSCYPLSEMAKDIAAAFLCVFFVVEVALLIIGVWG
jgi:hypothetical protein